jgi:hypothetical protein
LIYVNDDYGQWHSEKSKIVEACASEESPGRAVVQRIAPREDDYFVIKPQFSGFYSINLPVLLPKLGVSRLIITGIVADICVLFTAADAHMRAYGLWVPSDAVASETGERTRWALEIMQKSMQARPGLGPTTREVVGGRRLEVVVERDVPEKAFAKAKARSNAIGFRQTLPPDAVRLKLNADLSSSLRPDHRD